MDDPNRKLSPCGTQIEDLPPCLIIDLLSRLPIKSLVRSSLVCKSWFILFSDPLFVQLHRARCRSPSYIFLRRPRSPGFLFLRKSRERSKFLCCNLEGEIPGEDFKFMKSVSLPDSEFTCVNSCNGLLCLDTCKSGGDEIYVCNPVLGEYITIPVGNTDSDTICWSVLGFCSRSNQFKVLQISGSTRIATSLAKIYTIGNGTLGWETIGTIPSCTSFVYDPVKSFLNGSIHWTDSKTLEIFYFNFESEQLGSLPSPPAWLCERLSKFDRVRVCKLVGCLCIYPDQHPLVEEEVWMMKEYGVKESWDRIFFPGQKPDILKLKSLLEHAALGFVYDPSFISLQDVAKGEKLTVLSRTRAKSKTGSHGRDHQIGDLVSSPPVRRYKNPFLKPFVNIACLVLRFFTSANLC